MSLVLFTFRLRWVLVAMGLAVALAALALALKSKRSQELARRLARASQWAEPRFGQGLFVLAIAFFTLAASAKFLQAEALQLNAQDFWLFEDLLRSLSQGRPLLTRFAPQDLGFVQHGAVHTTLAWALALPLAWLFGATRAALLHGPLLLLAAALVLARLARPGHGALGAWAIAAAFLMSSSVGRVLTYDSHPEAAYPFFALLAFWAAQERKWPVLWGAIAAGLAVKEDAFLVFLPLLAITSLPARQKGVALLATAALSVLPWILLRHWQSSAPGAVWQGLPIAIPPAPSFHSGTAILAAQEGAWGALKSIGGFWISRPWLSFLAIAPMLLLDLRLWIALLPLTVAHALLGGLPATLSLYYSAPFLGAFWALAATSKRARLAWILPAALLVGSGGLEFPVPSPLAESITRQTGALAKCLKPKDLGVVTPPLLAQIDRARVWTDRAPRSAEHWARTTFVLYAPKLPRFEVPEESLERLSAELESPRWVRVGADCAVIAASEPQREVELYRRSENKTTGP